jgi:hypothetical protein
MMNGDDCALDLVLDCVMNEDEWCPELVLDLFL